VIFLDSSRSDRSNDVLSSAKDKINEEITEINGHILETEGKIAKFNDFIKKKIEEIERTKLEIHKIADIESGSKKQMDQNIELLTWLVDSIDNTVRDLRNSMISKSENAIKESVQNFIGFIQDLKEILEPMTIAKDITDPDEFKATIIAIAETLKMFVDNIEDSIDQMTSLVQKANATAVEESSQDFDNFVEDIHQIFDTFNTGLQKLQLTNSIKKYLDLEQVFVEIDRYQDQIQDINQRLIQYKSQREFKEEQIQNLVTYGLKKDFLTLKSQKALIQKKIAETELKLKQLKVQSEELADKLQLIDGEKTNLRNWFEALTDEIGEAQAQAAETYNVMYGLLDNIHSTISFIKSDIKNSSELAINNVIRDFTKTVLTFSRMVAIIKKVEQGQDLNKMQKSMDMIYQKSEDYIKQLNSIMDNLSNNVKDANNQSITESFKEFEDFVATFKQKFYIIQDNVTNITLSTSEQLIKDLIQFFEDKITTRRAILENQSQLMLVQNQFEHLQLVLQGIDNDLKIYGGRDERSRRKQLSEMRTVIESTIPGQQNITWKVSNDGIVPFDGIKIADLLPQTYNIDQFLPKPDEEKKISQGSIVSWNIAQLDKKEVWGANYPTDGYSPWHPVIQKFNKNIGSPDSYRYKKLAAPVALVIVEQEGDGAIILTNTAEKDKLWNIHLEFAPTPEIPILPNAEIIELKPQESFIKKYTYKKPHSLNPIAFQASFKYTSGLIKKRSTTRDNGYILETVFNNDSEFLAYLVQLEIFSLANLKEPLVSIKPIGAEILRPKMDYRKENEITTEEDPPNVVLHACFTVHLTYEYDISNTIKIAELNPTPEKEVDLKRSKQAPTPRAKVEDKPKGPVELATTPERSPEIIALDKEIGLLQQQVQEYQIKLANAAEQLKIKQELREATLIRIKKEEADLQHRREEERLRQIAEEKARAEMLKKQEEEAKKMAEMKAKLELQRQEEQKRAATEQAKLKPEPEIKPDTQRKEERKKVIAEANKKKAEINAKLDAQLAEERQRTEAKEARRQAEKAKLEAAQKGISIPKEKPTTETLPPKSSISVPKPEPIQPVKKESKANTPIHNVKATPKPQPSPEKTSPPKATPKQTPIQPAVTSSKSPAAPVKSIQQHPEGKKIDSKQPNIPSKIPPTPNKLTQIPSPSGKPISKTSSPAQPKAGAPATKSSPKSEMKNKLPDKQTTLVPKKTTKKPN
jgi:hypothetical protein